MRYTTKEIGDRGEDYAAAYLKQHQCIILDRNYRKRWGEIDIIAKDKYLYLPYFRRLNRKFEICLKVKVLEFQCFQHLHILAILWV